MNILHEAQIRQTDYNQVKQYCYFTNADTREVDVSVIIPVHGRIEFNRTVTIHFLNAIYFHRNTKNVSITFVEHSETPEHKDLCSGKNYIHIPQNKQPFNKCLAHNIGALYSNKAKYYLFHDTDILVPPDFFVKLFENLEHGFDALQSFTQRRLLYCNELLSKNIIENKTPIEILDAKCAGITPGDWGAQGGSIFVTKDMFFNAGGFDPEFFDEYGLEDRFFFDKLNLICKLGSCDNPAIELLHLFHAPAFNRTTKPEARDAVDSFAALSKEDKLKFIQIKSEQIKHFLIS